MTGPGDCRWCASTSTGLCASHLAEALRAGVRAQLAVRRLRSLVGYLIAAMVASTLLMLRLVLR